MILHSLIELYKRLADDPDIKIPEYGFSNEKISFSVMIDYEGNLVGVKERRTNDPKGKLRPKQMFVPKTRGRSGKNPPPYFLWDNAKYIFGVDKNLDKKSKDSYILVEDRFEAFKESIIKAGKDIECPEFTAVEAFVKKWKPKNASKIENIEEIVNDTGNLVFQVLDKQNYVHESKEVRRYWANTKASLCESENLCLISGDKQAIAPTHPLIKGVGGAQSAGAALISFNKNSFESFSKTQNHNSPISEFNAFAYTTALNYLTNFTNGHKIQIADTTTVFWSKKRNKFESMFGQIIDSKDDVYNQEVSAFLDGIRAGKYVQETDSKLGFYILGIAPNAARLSVRFWFDSTVAEITEKLSMHFSDLLIEKQFANDKAYPSLWSLLVETATLRKSDNIPPLLSGAVFECIMTNSLYPESFFNRILNRIRADRSINYTRAAIIKAILNRKKRILNKSYKEITVSLDKENKEKGYLLGRLFSVLEKAQRDAIGNNINSTIKDRFYGSASSTPKIVFPQLLKIAQHHFQKAKYGYINEKNVEEIMADLSIFPTHLNLEQQGMFALGYYHQRIKWFEKKE